jgi:hypothetical protein
MAEQILYFLPQLTNSWLLLVAVIAVVVCPPAVLLLRYLERKGDYEFLERAEVVFEKNKDAISKQEFSKTVSLEQSSTGSLEPAGTASNSRYSPEANRKFRLLEQAVDEASWKEAVRDGTREAYTRYLHQFPEGLNVIEVSMALKIGELIEDIGPVIMDGDGASVQS